MCLTEMAVVRAYGHRNRATLLFLSTCAWLTVPYLLHSSFTSLAMSSSQVGSVSLQTQDLQHVLHPGFVQAISSLRKLLQLNKGHCISADTYYNRYIPARPKGEGLRTRTG